MSPDTFDRQIEVARQRLEALARSAKDSADPKALVIETLEELSAALEELHVAAEELRQQNEELVATRQSVEAERQRYQDLFEHAPDGYLVTDPEGVIREANRAAASLLGVRQVFLVGKPLLVFLAERDRRTFQERLTGLQETPVEAEQIHDLQVHLKPREGVPFPAALAIGSMTDVNGRLTGLRWLLRDMTEERKRFEVQIRQAQKIEAIGTLAGGIAHDFNNVLSKIIGHTELAMDEVLKGSKAWQNLVEVLAAGRHARDVVKQILTFSRQSTQELKPVPIHQIVEEGLKLLRASLSATVEIRSHFDLESGMVLADPTQVYQVLMNLCANAEHAMREGGGVLDVRLEAVEVSADFAAVHPPLLPGPHARLTVRDTGHGMSAALRERIFDPFFTTKGPGEGTGLGLTVVHGIIAGHGGTITVESAPGKGATFEVYLPRCEAAASAEVPAQEVVPGGRERILIVDDEPFLAFLWGKMLERLGYQFVACSSGLEAMELFREAPASFDLVITDLIMPRLTGDALARDLLRVRPDIPVILCSGFSDSMSEEMAMALGVRAYLMKPLSRRDLALAVRRVLDQRVAQMT